MRLYADVQLEKANARIKSLTAALRRVLVYVEEHAGAGNEHAIKDRKIIRSTLRKSGKKVR